MSGRFFGGLLGGLPGELLELLSVYRGGAVRSFAPRPDAVPVAVVLGTQVLPGGRPSRTLDARVRHGARLYVEGRVERLVPTGGLGRHPPSEAKVMARLMRERGVPEEALLMEDRAKSTWDSARIVSRMAEQEGMRAVLVVTDPLHCVRAVAAFRSLGTRAWAEPVYSSPMWRDRWLRRGQFFRESGALVWYRMRHGVGARSRP